MNSITGSNWKQMRDVYAVVYKSPEDGWCAVAVSALTGSAAMYRVRDNRRPTAFCRAIKIKDRKPQYEQERIEGTCDLRNLMLPAPDAGSPTADEMRESNAAIIADWFTAAPMYRTSDRLLEIAAGAVKR